jgi:hypothetical protein
VNADPAALLRLYEEVGRVPDIWNLTEWSDWLLPAYRERAGQRYVNAPVKKGCVVFVVGYVSTNQLKKIWCCWKGQRGGGVSPTLLSCYTDKKENQIFLKYKEIRMEQLRSHIHV